MSTLSLRAFALGLASLPPPALAGDVSVTLDSGSGFSLKNSTSAIERLRVDEATGNVSRNGMLFVHTAGSGTFIGELAGNPAATGVLRNVGVGWMALRNNTTGYANVAVGSSSLAANTTGNGNSAVGNYSMRSNTTGSNNSAFGFFALGSGSGDNNSAFGHFALRINSFGQRNSAFGQGALSTNSTGSDNCAFGVEALKYNNAGYSSSAFGQGALRANTTGPQNSAFGQSALQANSTGASNSAFGSNALRYSTTGVANSAFGQIALSLNTTGASNAAFGQGALYGNTTGSRNVAVGANAGAGHSTGNDNIYLANLGVAAESGQIRIGTVGTHTQAHVAGIHGATSVGGVGVFVNASGTLGTSPSSVRFKQDVRDMGEASDLLMRLRPVSFRYREDTAGADESKATQYGLIAEEVAEVAPELVAPDLEGRPYSVKYHELPALLLNEVQEQQRELRALRRANERHAALISEQRQTIARLAQRLDNQESR